MDYNKSSGWIEPDWKCSENIEGKRCHIKKEALQRVKTELLRQNLLKSFVAKMVKAQINSRQFSFEI